ncbi:DUF4179 domain-containing protein [Aquibacillus koreensis]|uniref:DUF4179 domain-containing protein n=1 Tax=Aquibacillus koreensis TaxID=279446 RepID=A0A9X3WRE9_9BACI|nr:DUF4179 domain-containing protein [Aquibacillus koreensis]MCT2536899.1 DUF4179 domain-containing protein [Aquibacillus koreensis]MDC3421969.1 DUF4179 domain-containing protein [Aquibacillus koreensis]
MKCKKCRKYIKNKDLTKYTHEEIVLIEEHIRNCSRCNRTYIKTTSGLIHRLSPKTWGILTVSILFIVFITFTTGAMDKLASWWGDQSIDQGNFEEIKRFGLDNNLDLSVEDNGVKVTITHVLADDIQTFVYYEVEDLDKGRLLRISNHPRVLTEEGVFDFNQRFIDPVHSMMDLPDQMTSDTVYRGRIGMPPISEDEGEIELVISSLQEVNELNKYSYMMHTESGELTDGEWKFDIPIKKEEMLEKVVNLETDIAGYKIKINKVTIAPTTTLFEYQFKQEQDSTGYGLPYLQFDRLDSNEDTFLREDMSIIPIDDMRSDANWRLDFAAFDPMYYYTPDSIDLSISFLNETVPIDENFTINPDSTEPQTITVANTDVTIDDIKLGTPSSLTMNFPYTEDRVFERLIYDVFTDSGVHGMSYNNYEGIYVDYSGNEVNLEEMTTYTREMEKIRHYIIKEELIIESGNEDIVKPIGIRVHGYQKTTFPDQKIHVELN